VIFISRKAAVRFAWKATTGPGPGSNTNRRSSLALAWPAVDLTLYKALNGFANRHDDFEDVLRLFAVYAQYFFVALLGALFLARGKWRSLNARHGVIAAGFAALLALGAADLISHIWARPRPYVAHPDDAHLFIPASGDPSFPSDHATAAFAIAVSILLRHRRAGILALTMAVILSVGRVMVGTHYPSDVLAGRRSAPSPLCSSGGLRFGGRLAISPTGRRGSMSDSPLVSCRLHRVCDSTPGGGLTAVGLTE
jgi:undecaprenyl-diphosphatase